MAKRPRRFRAPTRINTTINHRTEPNSISTGSLDEPRSNAARATNEARGTLFHGAVERRLALVCRRGRVRADLHLAPVGKIDWRVEDDLVTSLDAIADFDRCAEIARHRDFAEMR